MGRSGDLERKKHVVMPTMGEGAHTLDWVLLDPKLLHHYLNNSRVLRGF
jgi:hypothetical protein